MGILENLFKEPDPKQIYVNTMTELNKGMVFIIKEWIEKIERLGETDSLNSFLKENNTLIFLWGIAIQTHDNHGGEGDIEGTYEILRQSILFSINQSGAYPKYINEIEGFGLSHQEYRQLIENKLLNNPTDEIMRFFEQGIKYSGECIYLLKDGKPESNIINKIHRKCPAINQLVELYYN